MQLNTTKLLSYSLLTIILSLSLTGCKKDIIETDQALLPYFDLFALEAEKRGITVDYELERIEGLLQDIRDESVLGQCFRNAEKPKKVIIDQEYWDEADEFSKQFLIFHELGHCFLNREHDDRSDASNVCISIMHSTPQACDFELTEENKKEYLDELFQ